MIESEAGRDPAVRAMQELIDRARVRAEAEAVVSDRPFADILRENSQDAACVFLGFEVPVEEDEPRWHRLYEAMLEDMPTTLIVNSVGGADMMA